MSDATPVERQRAALRDMLALTAERARTEAQLSSTFASRKTTLEKTSKQERAQIENRHAGEKGDAEAELAQARRDIPARAERLTAEARVRFDAARQHILDTSDQTKRQIDTEARPGPLGSRHGL